MFGVAAILAATASWSSCEESKSEKKGEKFACETCSCAFLESHSGLKIFTGNSNRALAQDVANQLGVSLGKITVNKFADGEVNVMVNENVRGKDVYIIQPTSPPVNETLMELLLMISTMRRASARKITAVIPYYGYARQDRKMQARVPISAADVARLLEAMV
jgi:ribose-phosphate pyrophosphokinase